jgi:hypothetical protein
MPTVQLYLKLASVARERVCSTLHDTLHDSSHIAYICLSNCRMNEKRQTGFAKLGSYR